MTSARVLIVDDEPSSLELLEVYLSEKGYEVDCAVDGAECIRKASSFNPEVIVLDVRLPDADGLEILEILKKEKSTTHIIIITAFHDMETTIKAMKQGAFEYIPKPIDVDDLEAAISRATDLSRSKEGGLVIDPTQKSEKWEIIGKTKEMKEIFKTIGILSGNRVTVLIEGETGTGKELVARAIHYHSPRKDRPFIAINCAAIVENLLESELFGHEKGSFTGAVSTKKGKFELAGDGTIFLDEIGEIPVELQVKLLRFLQEREFQRVGGERSIHSNARIIAATHRSLSDMVKEGRFRKDLYYRLNVAAVKIPPLRQRGEDIPLVIEHTIKKINKDLRKNINRVEGRALSRMVAYPWPGNVRELENVLTRAAMYTHGETILDRIMAPLIENRESPGMPAEQTFPDVKAPAQHRTERETILRALEESCWHYGRTCKSLGISRPTLNKKMERYNIPSKPRGS